ncbi:rac GTPase-activating protein 1 [Anoplopoma fimbria]|uniref:rac GTPase-activating protein 1 n=1 Tax=Anoplopoma fimbria TaxID=229290 RepID=UPI0023ECE1C1|nr:rac GTPase-activating protein 1 [Anoplopoma fimbria]
MEEARHIVEEVLALCLQRITMEETTMSTEREFMQVVKSFESVRKRWLHAELELKKYKELLVKSDVAKAALEVKLKHARNQLDVEMRKRYKMEGDYHYLQRQMQLMCDILVHDSKSSACLNAEQKSLLATFEHKGGNTTLHRSSKRLCVIDESSFLSHSDISYDRTDDDVDLDTTSIKPLRSRARERRRSSMGLPVGALVGKRGRSGNMSAELLERKPLEEVNTLVKELLMTPETGGQIDMVTPENPACTLIQECAGSVEGDQTSVWFPCDETALEPETEAKMEEHAAIRVSSTCRAERTSAHVFLSKTVIRPEMCLPCGKRMRFGKMAVKCRNCRAVAHPECKLKISDRCFSTATTGSSAQQNSLEDFAPVINPRVPPLIVECVTEIERRGLEERGLYRVPGGERLVKELRDRFLQGKTPLMLSKVHDVHVLCGLLKDFLRKLKEPLIPFRLHKTFMEASELADEDNSTAIMYQAIAELPKVNRDTLAFLMLHLQKVMRSPQCQMDKNNLSRVFGPTIVGHGMSEPTPTTIMRDTNTQPKVICRMLSLPDAYWRRVLTIQTDKISSSTTKTHNLNDGPGRLFEPLTSPELNSYYKTPSRGTLRGRIRNLGNALTSTGRAEPGWRFFTSPN